MEICNEHVSKSLTLLNSLKLEILNMQRETVSMETLIANLFKYFAVLKNEIVFPDSHSSGLQGQLEVISQSLTACKDLVLSHKSSGEVIMRQADLVRESCLKVKSASQSGSNTTFSYSVAGSESLENSLTLKEVKHIIGGSDSDDNDNGILDNFACLDATVKNEVYNDDPLGNQSSERLGNQSSSEVFINQSLSVLNESHNRPSKEVANGKNTGITQLQSHSQEDKKDPLRCKECRKNFNSKQALAYHLRHSKAHQKKLTKTSKTRASSRKTISETISAKSKLKPSRSRQKATLTGCTECGKCFKTVKALDVHMVQKHKGGRFTCGQCNKAYRSKAALEYHLTASNAHKNQVKIEEKQIEVAGNDSKLAEDSVSYDKTEEKPLSNDNTKDKSCINEHTKEKSVSNDNTKEKSVTIAPTKESLETDVIEIKYGCNVCGKGYKSRSGLQKHREKTKHVKKWNLSKDNKLIETPTDNEDRQANDAIPGSPEYKVSCEKCGRKLTSQRGLMGRCVRAKRTKAFICEQCGKKCSNKWCLKLHVDNIHKTPFLETCEVCGVQVPKLKQHMALHEEKQYKCPHCDKEFRWNHTLLKHLEHHSGIKPHMCDICGKSYTLKSSLEYHMAGHLNSKTLFTCDVCGKGFFHKSLLSKHQIAHSEAKFSCEVCGRSFTRNGSLQNHMVVHTGEKNHKCKICGEMFKYWTVLRRHLLVHRGEKPYVCPHCGKAFFDSWGRKQHVDRCLYGDGRRKENRDKKAASRAIESPVLPVSPIACEPVLTASPQVGEPLVSVNIGQQVSSLTEYLQE